MLSGKIALGAHSAKSAVEAASVIPTHNKHTEILSSVETVSKVVRVKHFYFLGQAWSSLIPYHPKKEITNELNFKKRLLVRLNMYILFE